MFKRALLTLPLTLALAGTAQADLASGINANEYLSGLYAGSAPGTDQDQQALWTMGFLNTANGYEYTPNLPLFTRYNHVGSASLIGFGHETFNGFGLNNSGGDVAMFNGAVGTDEMYAHHGNADHQGLYLRFTAQTNATYQFDMLMRAIDQEQGDAGGKINLALYHNGNSLGGSVIDADGISYASTYDFTQSIVMNAGDHFDLYSSRYNDGFNDDSFTIKANVREMNIANVSAPLGLGTLALGLLGAGAMRRRKTS
jgi:hypothetical protein